MHPDAHSYSGRLWVIQSHLKAAREIAVGTYLDNPATHGFPEVDGLAQRLQSLLEEVAAVREKLDS